jgi:WD40 repeat protein
VVFFKSNRVKLRKRGKKHILYLGAIALIFGAGIWGIWRYSQSRTSGATPTANSPSQNRSNSSPAPSDLVDSSSSENASPSVLGDETEVATVSFRLAATLTGATWTVNDLAITPDGQRVFASDYASIRSWELGANCFENRACTATGQFEIPALWIYSLAIHPNGELLASGTWKEIKLWNLGSGDLLGSIPAHLDAVTTLAISPDGRLLISGSNDATLEVRNLQELTEAIASDRDTSPIQIVEAHSEGINALAIAADGKTLVSGSSDGGLKVWDLNAYAASPLRLRHTLAGHENDVRSVAIAPDGERLASGSLDKTIAIWNLKTGRLLSTDNPDLGTVLAVAISPDGELLVSGGGDRRIEIWDLKSGKLLQTLTGHSGSVKYLIFSEDSQLLLSGSEDKTIRVWRRQG